MELAEMITLEMDIRLSRMEKIVAEIRKWDTAYRSLVEYPTDNPNNEVVVAELLQLIDGRLQEMQEVTETMVTLNNGRVALDK